MSRFEILNHDDEDDDEARESETFKSLYQKNRVPGMLLTDEDIKKFEMEQSLLTHEDI